MLMKPSYAPSILIQPASQDYDIHPCDSISKM